MRGLNLLISPISERCMITAVGFSLGASHADTQISYRPNRVSRALRRLNIPGGVCIITTKLPERDGEPVYRVKTGNEDYERVVSESQMKLTGD